MNYEQVVGQKESKSRLLKMVNENRVPHALLFAGNEGCGNLPAAIIFAQHLFCQNKRATGPCNQCNSCLKVNKLAHPDLHLVFPIAKLKEVKVSEDLMKEFREAFFTNSYLTLNEWFAEISSENKQPLISVEEANEIVKKLSYTSYEGSYKVMLIWQPEKMNLQAANTILKILEEPTDKTIFILVTNQIDALLATILSRVQLIPFTASSMDEISEALVKQFKVEPEKAKQTAFLANGSYSEALSLLKELEEGVSFLNNFQTFMRLAFSFDYDKFYSWLDENVSLGREKHKQFLQYGLEVFRDCLMYNFGERNLVRLNGQEMQFLEKFAPFINQSNYEALINEFNSNYYFIERNANPKILFMDLFIKCNALIAPKRN